MSNFNDDIDWDGLSSDDELNDMVDAPPAPPVFPSFPAPPAKVGVPVPNEVVKIDDVVSPDSASIVSVANDGGSELLTVIQVDSHGNEISTQVDMALPPLNETEAREITERIKGTTNLLYLLIKRAHAGKAYKALGYSSFEAYVREEFNYSRSYAYKLLNQANVIEAIESVVPEGTEVYVGELTARGLKSSLPELLEDIEERTMDASPDEAQRLIEEAIREHQARQNEVEEAYEDFDEYTPGEAGEGYSPSYANGDLDDLLEDTDDTVDEFLTEDPTLLIKRLEGLWSLINGLQAFNDLSETADLDELLQLIKEDRFVEVSRLIDVSINWLATLKEAWDEYKENYVVSDKDEIDNNSENTFDGDFENEDFGDIRFD